ncbi:hypothetical protein HYY75_05765 [bacterium]|nr:hypothetical protein [bacterium]
MRILHSVFRSNQDRGGFAIYLAILVTIVLFYATIGGHEVGRASLDMGRSILLETTAFHAADGGLERGLAKLRAKFSPFEYSYSSDIGSGRKLLVQIFSTPNGRNLASVYEGRKKVAGKKLARFGISRAQGRSGCGKFMEEP